MHNEDNVKIYKFYYKGNIEDSTILHPSEMTEDGWDEVDEYGNEKKHTKYPLYAWTDIKKYAKEFKKQRNKEKFILIKSEVSDEELSYLHNTYQDLILNRYEFNTRDIDNEGCVSIKPIEIVATMFEYLSCTEDHDMVFMEDVDYWAQSLPVQCYNTKIQKALATLDYPLLRNMFYGIYIGNPDGDMGYNYADLTIDELSLFIYNFQETLG